MSSQTRTQLRDAIARSPNPFIKLSLFEAEDPNDLSDGLDGVDPNSDEAEDALSSCEEAIAPSKSGYILNVINENKTEEDISS